MKHLYVVLGMARSGTSAIARGLQALGVDLGNKLTPGAERWNAKGFFEDNDIVYKINRTALHLLDSPWGMKPLAPANYGENATMQKLHNYATKLLKERTEHAAHWGFKDPRTATLLPFWQPIFKELNFNEHYLIAVRNPLASASSYQRLSGCDLEEALIMWLMHMIPAVHGTMGKNRVIVSYDRLMENPDYELGRVKQALNIPDSEDENAIKQYANEFLDRKLQRHVFTDAELKAHPKAKAVPLVLKTYELLSRLSKDEVTFEEQAFKTMWADIMAEFEYSLPVYSYINALMVKNKRLEREIRTIHKSVVWKLIYPLRLIDDALRKRRRKTREQKRLHYATK